MSTTLVSEQARLAVPASAPSETIPADTQPSPQTPTASLFGWVLGALSPGRRSEKHNASDEARAASNLASAKGTETIEEAGESDEEDQDPKSTSLPGSFIFGSKHRRSPSNMRPARPEVASSRTLSTEASGTQNGSRRVFGSRTHLRPPGAITVPPQANESLAPHTATSYHPPSASQLFRRDSKPDLISDGDSNGAGDEDEEEEEIFTPFPSATASRRTSYFEQDPLKSSPSASPLSSPKGSYIISLPGVTVFPSPAEAKQQGMPTLLRPIAKRGEAISLSGHSDRPVAIRTESSSDDSSHDMVLPTSPRPFTVISDARSKDDLFSTPSSEEPTQKPTERTPTAGKEAGKGLKAPRARFWRFSSKASTPTASRPQTASSINSSAAQSQSDQGKPGGRFQKSDSFCSSASAGSSSGLGLKKVTSIDSVKSAGDCCKVSTKCPFESASSGPKSVKVKTRGKGLKNRGLEKMFLTQDVVLSPSSSSSTRKVVESSKCVKGSESSRSSVSRRESWGCNPKQANRRNSVRTNGSSSDVHDDSALFGSFGKKARSASFVDDFRPPMPHADSTSSVVSRATMSTVATSVASSEGHPQSPTRTLSALPSLPTPSKASSKASKAASTWALQFSKDGKYLAAAGSDRVIRIFEVLSTQADRDNELDNCQLTALLSAYGGNRDGDSTPPSPMLNGDDPVATSSVKSKTARAAAPIFKRQPIREFTGHTNDVLDLCWSKNDFLLSCSMDKSAKVWHPTMPECLCTFGMPDMVTSVAFHPTDDRYFISGSLDGKLRLWNVSGKRLQASVDVPGMITAVAFTANGKVACAGTYNGAALFYECGESLKYTTSIAVRSSKSGKSKAAKITGISAMPGTEDKIMITSNDSRIRLYTIKEKKLVVKLKAPTYVNRSSQIKASLDAEGFAVCGSEDSNVYVWDTKEESACMWWTAGQGTITAAVMAPLATNALLEQAGDTARGRLLVSVDKSGSLKVWRSESST